MINFRNSVNLTDFTLILPTISVGNVPQLTVDLIITTYDLKIIGTVFHPGLVQAVGSDPFYSNLNQTICSACEIYANESLKIATIQLRSTIEKKLLEKFIRDLMECVSRLNFKKIIILATGFDYELHNVTNKEELFYKTNDCEEILLIKPLENMIISGSGIATKLYEESINRNLKTILLIKYVSEGDNAYDAEIFLIKLSKLIMNFKLQNFKYPVSWQFVYGSSLPMGLF